MLQDKVALVTGSTSGIGEQTARLFAKEGAKVIISGRRAERGEKLVAEIKAAGGEATFIQCDMTHTEQIKNLVDKTVETYGRLDIAVNNAAENPDNKLITDMDEDKMDRLLMIDIKGTAVCMKHEINQMLKQGDGGSVINIGSCITSRVQPASIGYIAAKYAVLGMTEGVAKEVSGQGVRVNCIRPGAIWTDMLAEYFQEMGAEKDAYAQSQTALGRCADPKEIADGCLWLASDLSSYVTGSIIDIDGGYRLI
ncbi:SDR family NAD(P)-dependent oxidoreductase [Adlercreutzia sp. ZJ141]|uniref:SDR family NAD(P)-dependent oxidoreductase n=1 Tax=Adlercreutzia sp. ZJ141 TaxID=2709406 RepID=UPI0013EA01A6|nr:glucose 1-dehydrogenase [Adlercreutzia sp. ZJ141]